MPEVLDRPVQGLDSAPMRKSTEQERNELFEKVYNTAYKYFKQSSFSSDKRNAQDLAQDVAEYILENESLQNVAQEKLTAMIYYVARRVGANKGRERKAQKRGGGKKDLGLENVLVLGAKDLGLNAEQKAMLHDFVGHELEGDERLIRIFYFKFIEGETYEEIAEKLGLSVTTVGRDVEKISEKLKLKGIKL